MKNHLFIGLGGQGGRTLGELRKVMAQRATDSKALRELDVASRFLAIDSSDDVRNDHRNWTDFGTNLSLDPNDWLILSRPAQGTIGQLALRPDIAPWLGDRKRVERFLAEGNIQGANQRRRFGRLLFAHNARDIRSALAAKVDSLTTGRQRQCAFHIFATLGGGTGSGSLLDLVTMIRTRYPGSDISEFPIFAYVYVTDEDEKGADVGYFFQNQFAALRDLNALMCGRVQTQLLGDDIPSGTFSGTEPIAQLAVSSGLNSANRQIVLDTQIRIVAEACFERIFAWSSGQMSPDAQRSLTGQDILATFPAEPDGRPERSYRFSAFGMRRWEVPHAKIEKLLALDLLVGSLRQMLFNHWHETRGFLDQLASSAAGREVGVVPELLKEIENPRRASPQVDALAQTLRNALSQQAAGCLRESDQAVLSLRSVEHEFETFYLQRFEAHGVEGLLRQREMEQPANVAEAIRLLELRLTELWLDRTDPIALGRIPQLLDDMTARLRRDLDPSPANETTIATRQRRIEARRVEWDKLTWLSTRFTGKRRQLVEHHAADCSALHESDLRSRLVKLDGSFVRDFLGRLSGVINRFQVAQQTLRNLLGAIERERDVIDRELRDLHRDSAANKYEFDPSALDAFLDAMRRDRERQSAAAFHMRQAIRESIGVTQPLAALGDTLTVAIEDQLRRVAKEQAVLSHQDYTNFGKGQAILKESVLDVLEERYRRDRAEFLTEVQVFLEQAAVCLSLRTDTQPMQLLGSGVGVSSMPKRLLLIGLPRHAFRTDLEREFRKAMAAGQRGIEIFEHNDPGQIRLLAADYWLAARFANVVKALSDRFEATTASQLNSDTIYFCNIDPAAEQGLRPSLLLPNEQDMRLRYEAELWLGQQSGIDVVRVDQNGVSLIRLDQDGRHPELLGVTLEGTLENPDYHKMFDLHKWLSKALGSIDRQTFDELLSRKRTEVEQAHGLTSTQYRHWDRMLLLLKPLVD